MTTATAPLSLDTLKTRYPDGYHSVAHGCYYFTDYDGEVGLYIEMADGTFDEDISYVELDTMNDADRAAVLQELTNLG